MPENKHIDYLHIFFPQRYIIAGVELKQLSLGHLLFFENFNLDYRLSHIQERKPEDNEAVSWNMILMLMICSRNWEENHKLNDLYLKEPAKWKKEYDRIKTVEFPKYDLNAEYSDLMDYLAVHLNNSPPTFKTQVQEKFSPSDALLGSPELLSLITSVVTRYNDSIGKLFRVENPLDVPYDAVLWLSAVKAEMDGTISVEPTDDEEYRSVFERAKKLETKYEDPKKRFEAFMSGSIE